MTSYVDDNPFPKILIIDSGAPSTPASGVIALYVDPADDHLKYKDDGGSVTDITAGLGGGGGSGAVPSWHYTRTAGNYTPSGGSGTFVNIDGTNLAGTIAAAAGDVLEFGFNTFISGVCYIDIKLTASSTRVGGGGQGIGGWSGGRAAPGGPVMYTVQSGDISGGNVAFTFQVDDNGTGPTIWASTLIPLFASCKNLKH